MNQFLQAVNQRLAITCCFLIACSAQLFADETQTTPVIALRDLDSHCPMVVSASLDAWQARAVQLRRQLMVALAVHPQPKFSDAAPTIYGLQEFDGYSIEKIYFESLPGFYVTGSLYRPLKKIVPIGGFPAVLYAHGHWENGRFYEAPEKEVRQLLASGAERFENAAINHMQAACVQLARMGCVVLQYDMIGYADSQQISFERAHHFGLTGVSNPPAPADALGWLLYSAKAEGYGQSVMALQTINGLRAFELLHSMPGIDVKRIAITGASGGGTQSFILSAIEPRIAGAFPAVMVSTGMQGGCTCENACGLRVGTGNIELAALTAPRPLGMTTAKDWTETMPTDGFPELKKLFGLFGKEGNVELFPAAHFPHNFNHVSRVAMYGWMSRLFDLYLDEPILERDFELQRKAQLTVWDEKHPAPESGLDYERKLMAQWAEMIKQPLGDRKVLTQQFRDLVVGWQTIIAPAVDLAKSFSIERVVDSVSLVDAKNKKAFLGRIKRHPKDFFRPVTVVDVVISSTSKQKIIPEEPVAIPESLQTFIDQRNARDLAMVFTLEACDLLGGEDTAQSLVSNPRPVAAYTYGYNAPRIIRKLAALIRLLQEHERLDKKPIRLIVTPDDAFIAFAASLYARVESVVVVGNRDEAMSKFDRVDSITHNDFLPGSLRYQGMEGLLSLMNANSVVFEPAR